MKARSSAATYWATDENWHYYWPPPTGWDENDKRNLRSKHVCEMTQCQKQTRIFAIAEERNRIYYGVVTILLTIIWIAVTTGMVYLYWNYLTSNMSVQEDIKQCQNITNLNITVQD